MSNKIIEYIKYVGIVPLIIYSIFGYIIALLSLFFPGLLKYAILETINIPYNGVYYILPSFFTILLFIFGFSFSNFIINLKNPYSKKYFGFIFGFLTYLIMNLSLQYELRTILLSVIIGFIVSLYKNWITNFIKYILGVIQTYLFYALGLYILYEILWTPIGAPFGTYLYEIFMTDINKIFDYWIYFIPSLALFFSGYITNKTYSKMRKLVISNRGSTFIIGPKGSGKTILGIGLFYATRIKNYGMIEPDIFTIRKGDDLDILDLYNTFISKGIKGMAGTERGEFSVFNFYFKRDLKDAILFGITDVIIELIDYAGEFISDVAKLVRQKERYKAYAKSITKNIYPEIQKGLFDEDDTSVISQIVDDIKNNQKFDFKSYRDYIDWNKVKIIDKLAPIYLYCKIKNSDKAVFLLDGEKLARKLYRTNPELENNLKNMEKQYPKYSELIKNILNDSDETIDEDLNNYWRIIKGFKKSPSECVFVITKADILVALFGSTPYNLITSNSTKEMDSIKKERLLHLLEKDASFKGILESTGMTIEEFMDNTVFTVVLSKVDIPENEFRKNMKNMYYDDMGCDSFVDEEIIAIGMESLISKIKDSTTVEKLKKSIE